MSAQTATPAFIYSRPVQPGEFLNREAELRTIFNRLRNCESTAVAGEPHSGKSSLLLQLADEATQRVYLGDDVRRMVVFLLDLHSIDSDYTPVAFWKEALEPLREHPDHRAISRQLEQAAQTGYARRSLDRLFGHLGRQERRLVLLLDEFEHLLFHPNFQDPAFFALLRSLGTRTGGLALVTASRLSVAKMNEHGQNLLATGSPFFNNMIEVRLYPFDEQTVATLLNRAGDALSPGDRRFIRRVAGRHPFLLQAMAAALVETTGDDRQARAAETFYERISFHFDDLWRTLDDRTRTTAVILVLVELGQRVFGRNFASSVIEQIKIEHEDVFDRELRKLTRRGLAEQVVKKRWTTSPQAFAWWVRDVIITRARQVPACDEWLANEGYLSLLTQEQWDWLVSAVNGGPEWALRGVSGLAQALFEELVEGK